MQLEVAAHRILEAASGEVLLLALGWMGRAGVLWPCPVVAPWPIVSEVKRLLKRGPDDGLEVRWGYLRPHARVLRLFFFLVLLIF